MDAKLMITVIPDPAYAGFSLLLQEHDDRGAPLSTIGTLPDIDSEAFVPALRLAVQAWRRGRASAFKAG